VIVPVGGTAIALKLLDNTEGDALPNAESTALLGLLRALSEQEDEDGSRPNMAGSKGGSGRKLTAIISELLCGTDSQAICASTILKNLVSSEDSLEVVIKEYAP